MKIYYEDNDVIVCEKPWGVSSQQSEKENMIDMLSLRTGAEIYPIHRLDITTDGVMVYAKNKRSAAALCRQAEQRTLKKEYICVVHGITEPQGEMTDLLFHDRLKNKSFVVKTTRAGAKEAKLEYKTLGVSANKSLSLVLVKLHTGRTHQIRVQFSSRGHALYGDGKYGAKDNGKIALHSYRLSFTHPATGENMTFTSPPSAEIYSEFSKTDG